MKKLELQNFGVQELDAREMIQTDGGNWGALVGFLLERAWEHRDDIIGTSNAIREAYKTHPEALLK